LALKAAMRGEQNFPYRMTKVLLMDRFDQNYHELMSTPAYIVRRMIRYMHAESEVRDEAEAAQTGDATKKQVRDGFALAREREVG